MAFSCGEILLQLLIIGLSNGAIIALNALGVTLVYSIVRTINFAYGDLFSLASVVSATALLGLGVSAAQQHSGFGAALAMVAALALAAGSSAGLNVAIERLAFRPFRAANSTAPLIATIGISFMLYQGALLLRNFTNAVIPGEHRSVPGIPEVPRRRLPELLPETDVLRSLGINLDVSYPLKDLLLVLFAIAVCLLTHRALARTRVGRALRACAQDPEMAQLCGVNRDGTIRLVFALGGALGGVAAWAFTLYHTHPFTNYGVQSGLLAFTAAILGGVGRPRGALLSGLTLGVLAAFSDYFLATQWTPVLSMAVLIALLVLRPTGLAGDQGDDAPTPGIGAPAAAPRRRLG
ncbi:MAG TPA: branched-chain amino acid ABC transporter permease, partial [Herpetosiphonaceae bacterium]